MEATPCSGDQADLTPATTGQRDRPASRAQSIAAAAPAGLHRSNVVRVRTLKKTMEAP